MLTEAITGPQIDCAITRTTEAGHAHHPRKLHRFADVFRRRSPAGGRAIAPRSRTRSCASATATAHQIFLEPEGLDDPTVYPNGISTSLPDEVQLRISCATIPGLEKVADAAAGLCDRI